MVKNTNILFKTISNNICYKQESYGMNLHIHEKLILWLWFFPFDIGNHFCVYFDYVLDGIGSVEVYVNNIMNFESALTSIFGNYPNWTTRRVAVHESNPVNEVCRKFDVKIHITVVILLDTSSEMCAIRVNCQSYYIISF